MMPEPSSRKHNLPAPVSSFIGREQELREIQLCLGEYRLITLTGTGGTGKTRLALQAATAEIDHFSDGVWLIDLAPLVTAELVLETIVKVLTLPEAPGPSLIERLGAYLEVRHVLLVLDNCEQVIEECTRIVASLLARCPRLTLLATSREPLRINGEVVLRVPALSLPAEAEPVDRTRWLSYDALRLFVERTQAADSSFRLTDDNAGVVAEICRHLDGLPLALELAAVRVRGLGVARLSAGLDQRFQLLTGGDRTALPRQQTLHAMIDWSYRLLPEPERVLLRRLGIFVGAFSLQAAESICAGTQSGQNGPESIPPETILQSLLQLVNKSLVQFNQESGRYRLLETIHIFSLEQLTEVGETPSLHRQHFAWYLQLAEHAAPNLFGPQQEAWFALLEAEHDNLRAALGWALGGERVSAKLGITVSEVTMLCSFYLRPLPPPVAYPLLRVEIQDSEIERVRGFPPGLLRPASIEPFDLKKDAYLSSGRTAKATDLAKLASQLAVGTLQARGGADEFACDSVEMIVGNSLLKITGTGRHGFGALLLPGLGKDHQPLSGFLCILGLINGTDSVHEVLSRFFCGAALEVLATLVCHIA